MARVGTTNLDLGKYLDGENPGSGPQDTTPSGGLNGDKNKIDVALGTGHNADGSHKSAVIDAANLKSTVVDGSSLEQNTSTKKLNVKAGGVVTAMIADDSVVKEKIGADVAGSGLKQNTNGSLSPDVDGTTVTINGSGKLVAAGKSYLPVIFSFDSATLGMMIGSWVVDGAVGIPVPAGTIKRLLISKYSGNVVSLACSIALGDASRVWVGFNDGVNENICRIMVNGSDTGVALDIQNSSPATGTLLIEL